MMELCKLNPWSMKYDISKPFVHNGWKYATNGRLCVRVKCKGRNSEGNFPPAEKLFDTCNRIPQKWPKRERVGKQKLQPISGFYLAGELDQFIRSLRPISYVIGASTMSVGYLIASFSFRGGCGVVFECKRSD